MSERALGEGAGDVSLVESCRSNRHVLGAVVQHKQSMGGDRTWQEGAGQEARAALVWPGDHVWPEQEASPEQVVGASLAPAKEFRWGPPQAPEKNFEFQAHQ